MRELARWARAERRYLDAELKCLEDGARLILPNGDDVTADKIAELRARLDHTTVALGGVRGC